MKKHITTQGDTWDYLAKKYYGNEYLFGVIMQANLKFIDSNMLPSNVEIIIPKLVDSNTKIIESIW